MRHHEGGRFNRLRHAIDSAMIDWRREASDSRLCGTSKCVVRGAARMVRGTRGAATPCDARVRAVRRATSRSMVLVLGGWPSCARDS